ncbi:class I SAM-dependent methyltransferase [Minwuia sp.]|uniref:class I SAM-dependent methyltransferase n=1 Tax=Minwuia sp. TaxID=2493630 RepID=UPI003A93FF34
MPGPKLKTRLKAWWEGYDVPPDRDRGRQPPEGRIRATIRCEFSPEIDTMHMIFGRGRTLPLPTDPIADLTDPISTPSGMATLIVGAETGGPPLHLAQAYGMQITALEPDRTWASIGDGIARAVDFEGTFRIGPVDLPNVELSKNRYHLVISRLLLHACHNREQFYRKVERSLRRDGEMILTHYVLTEKVDREAIETAMISSREPDPPALRTQSEEVRMLTESGLRVGIVEDRTGPVLARLTEQFGQWQRLVEKIQQYDQQPAMLQALLGHVEHWQSRISLMKSGDLLINRFRAQKRQNELL